jgi:hypothetical protein
MALLNVRLDEHDARRVAELKRAGVKLSDVVRAAIRAEHERRLAGVRASRRPSRVMAEIYASLPDPPDLPARDYDVRDRQAARRAIRQKLLMRREP